MPLPIEPLALDAWPITVDAVGYLKNLTDADSSISLPVGGYQIALVSSSTDGEIGRASCRERVSSPV